MEFGFDLSSELIDDLKSPWGTTLKAVRNVINVFLCSSCKSVADRIHESKCCNIYFCRKCLVEKQECSKCHLKLKPGESIDVNIPHELCTRLLTLLNLQFETVSSSLGENVENKNASFDLQSGETSAIDAIDRDLQNSETEKIRTELCDDASETLKPFLSSQVKTSSNSSTFSDKLTAKSLKSSDLALQNEGMNSEFGCNVSDNSSKKRKLEAVDSMDCDDEDVILKGRIKKVKCQVLTSSEKVRETIDKVLSPNAEIKLVADSLLMLQEAPISIGKISELSEAIPTTINTDCLITPSKPATSTSNSSAFLTPASECRPVGKSRRSLRSEDGTPRIKSSEDNNNNIQPIDAKSCKRQNSKKSQSSRDLNATLDSFLIPPKKSRTNKGSSLPCTPPKKSRTNKVNSLPCTPPVTTRQNKGQDEFKRNKKGETDLHIACIKGNLDLAKKLLDNDIDPNVRDYAEWTPLHEACNHGFDKLVRLILEKGANVDAIGDNHSTPLHDAVTNNHLNCVQILLEHGADANIRNKAGQTPSFYAKSSDIMELLRIHSEKPSTLSSNSVKVSKSVRPKKIVITTTGVDKGVKSWLTGVINNLGWDFHEEISEDVTHVITSVNDKNACQRTLKYMMAIAMGTWIVTADWLKACESAHDWIAEDKFVVSGCNHWPDSSAPLRAHSNAMNRAPGIFGGCNVFISNSITNKTSRLELASLIQSSSGQLLSREPKIKESDVEAMDLSVSLDATSGRGDSIDSRNNTSALSTSVPFHASADSPFAFCSYFIVQDSLAEECGYKIVNKRLCKVTTAWVYNSISSFSFVQ